MKSKIFLFCLFISGAHQSHKSFYVDDLGKCQRDADCKAVDSFCCDTYLNKTGGEPVENGKICHKPTSDPIEIKTAQQGEQGQESPSKWVQKCECVEAKPQNSENAPASVEDGDFCTEDE